MTTGRLQSGVNTLQGFKEDKRNKVTPGKPSVITQAVRGGKKHNFHFFSSLGGIFAT